MTPMELLIAALIVWWMLRRLVVDSAAAIRGHAPPRWNGTGRSGGHPVGGRGRRYGARGYLADLWSDAWTDARARRVAKREARAAAGNDTDDAATSRWSRLRSAVGGRWDAAWGRWETRRDNHRGSDAPDHRPEGTEAGKDEAARPEPEQPDTRTSGHDGRTGGEDPAPPAADRAAADDTTDQPTTDQPTSGQGPQPDTPAGSEGRVLDARRDGDRWVVDPDPATGAGSNPNPQPGRDNQAGGNQMAEATGLTTSITYAADMSKANEANVAEAEGFAASLEAQGVSGPAVDAAHRAMEAQQQAAAAWRQVQTALEAHLGVKEQYDAHPDAGSREFVTSE